MVTGWIVREQCTDRMDRDRCAVRMDREQCADSMGRCRSVVIGWIGRRELCSVGMDDTDDDVVVDV